MKKALQARIFWKFSLLVVFVLSALVQAIAAKAPLMAAPVVVNDENYGVEATTLTGNVGENDFDPDGDVLTFTLLSAPTSGSFTLDANGNYSYVPLPEFNGFAYAVYRACDPSGNCATGTLELALLFVNDNPVINNDNFFVTVNTSLSNSVATNDYDVDIEPIFNTVYTQPTNGTVTLNYTTGVFTYTPFANFIGTDTWMYYGCDPCGVCATGTVTMTVIPPNDPPLADDDYVFMLEDTSVSGSVATNDTDPNNDQLIFNIESNVTNGTFTMTNAGAFTYVPGPNFSGFQYVEYSVCDIYGGCDLGELLIEVAEINDAPIAGNDTFTGNEDQQITGNVGQNDFDPDVEVLIYLVTQQVNVGTMTLATNGNVVYTPPANWSGTATARYWAIDPCGEASAVATITFVVNPVNDAPVAVNDSFSGDENSVIIGTIATNDTDPEGDALSFEVFTAPTNGVLVIQGNGNFTYTPNANYYGIDQAVYRVTDAGGATSSAQITFQVISTNTNPELIDETVSVQEDGSLNGSVATNDIPQIGFPVTYSLATAPNSGVFVLNSNGSFSYTPAPNFNGTITATYIGNDASGGSDIGTLTLVVTPVNDAPLAQDDNATVLEDHTLNGLANSNDSDLEGNILSYSVLTEPMFGILVLNTNGSFVYTPNPNENGSDSFEYQVSDGNGGVDIATVFITIVSVNDAPIVFDDEYSTNEDASISGALGDNDFDLDGDALSYSLTALAAHGNMQFNTDGTFTYTPDFNFYGQEVIEVSVQDGQDGIETTVLTIDVLSVNDVPVALGESYFIAEDELLSGNVSTNDSDLDNEVLTYSIATNVAHGVLVLNTNGTFTYQPDAAFNGSDDFIYQINDGNGGVVTATANIFVNSVNSPPVAGDDNFVIDEDEVLISSVATNDSDVEMSPLVYSLVTDVMHGTVLFSDNGSFTYHSSFDYFGTDSFTYSVSDGLASTTATVNITILSVNDGPVAHYDTFVMNEDEVLSADVSLNDSDAENDVLNYTVIVTPTRGILQLNTDGTLTYEPEPNYDGVDYFVYEVNDGNGGSITANVNIIINSVNDAPTALNDSYTMLEDGIFNGNVSTNDTDDDTANLIYAVQTNVSSGNLVLQPNGTFTFTPVANYFGTVTATISVSDDGSPAYNSLSTLTIVVTSVDDATVVQDETFTVAEGTLLNGNVALNDSDADANLLTYTTSATLTGGTFVFNPNGSFSFQSVISFVGVQTFDYSVCDENNVCSNGTCTIVVNDVNFAPVAGNDEFTLNEDTPYNGNVSVNDSDPDGDQLSYTLQSQPIYGTVIINSNGTFVYTPNNNYNGPDGFKYVVSDPNGLTAAGNVLLNVLPLNDAPVANDDVFGVIINGTGNDMAGENDIEVDGDNLVFSLVYSTSLGTLVFNADGSYTYTPNADVYGQDSFAYEVCDGSGLCDEAVVVINIEESNNAPVAGDDGFTTIEDEVLNVTVSTNDTDADGNALTYTVQSAPANGTLLLNLDGSFQYAPNANYFGSDSFTYNVCDIFNICDQAVVTIAVTSVNDMPEVNDDYFTTDEDMQLNGSLALNDSDVETVPMNYTVTTATQHGVLIVSPNGNFVYTPNPNFNGSDMAVVQVRDTGTPVHTLSATLYIEVTSIDDVTLVVNDDFIVADGYVLEGDVSVNDSDADALALSYTLNTDAQGGTMIFNADGTFVYTPDIGYSGVQTLVYEVCDENGLCTTGELTITTTPYNHVPSAMSVSLEACEGEVISVPLNSLVSDEDEPASALQLSALSGLGGALNYLDESRIIVFEPQTGFVGEAIVNYSVCDNGIPQQCASGIITINFNAIETPVVLEEAITSVSCFGESNGTISLTLSGEGNIEVAWNDGPTGTSRTGLQAGTYEAILSSDALCALEGQYSVMIVQPNELQVSGLTGFYDGTSAGSSDYTVSGGTEPYSYYWTNDAGEIIWSEKILFSANPGMFTLTVTDANGCSVGTNVDAVSSVSEVRFDNELTIYPNPTSDILNMKFTSACSEIAEIRVLDASGRLVMTKQHLFSIGTNIVSFDTANLAAGTYQFTLELVNELVTRTFVKSN